MLNPNDNSFLLLPNELLLKITSHLTLRQLYQLVQATSKNKRGYDFKSILAMRKNIILREPEWSRYELNVLFDIIKPLKVVVYPTFNIFSPKHENGVVVKTPCPADALYQAIQYNIARFHPSPSRQMEIDQAANSLKRKASYHRKESGIYSNSVKELIIIGPYHEEDRVFDFPNVTHLTLAQNTYANDYAPLIWLMALFPGLKHFKISINIAIQQVWLQSKSLKLETLSYIEPSNDHKNIQDLPFPNEMTIETRSEDECEMKLGKEFYELFKTSQIAEVGHVEKLLGQMVIFIN